MAIPKVDYEGSSRSTVGLLSTAEGFAGASALQCFNVLACFCLFARCARNPWNHAMQFSNVGPCCQVFLFIERVSSQATGFPL